MPIELKRTRPTAEAADSNGLALFTPEDVLTLPGNTIADFLESCDFTKVAESQAANPFLVLAEEGEDDEDPGDAATGGDDDADDGDAADDGGDSEDGEADSGDDEEPVDPDGAADDSEDPDSTEEDTSVEVLLPGTVVARLVDEDDLVDMFGFYLGKIAESVNESDAPMLQERAALACFKEHLDEDGILDESRGAVAEMIREVLSNGTVSAEIDEKFLSKGQRLKVARIRKKPKSGKKRMMLKKRRREEKRGAKKAKIARQKKMFKRKRASRIKMLAREDSTPSEERLLFGLGGGIEGAGFKVSLSEAPDLDFEREDLLTIDRQLGNLISCPECDASRPFHAFMALGEGKVPPQFLKNKKGKKDGKDDSDDEKSKKDESDVVEMACPKCEHKFVVEAQAKSIKKGDRVSATIRGKDQSGVVLEVNRPLKGGPRVFKIKLDNGTTEMIGYKDVSPMREDVRAEESLNSRGPMSGAFAVAAGRPDINEGSRLAGSTLATMGIGRKTLSEG